MQEAVLYEKDKGRFQTMVFWLMTWKVSTQKTTTWIFIAVKTPHLAKD